MKTKKVNTAVGNVTLVIRTNSDHTELLLTLKPPKKSGDDKRKRKIVGSNLWVPPGGAKEVYDRSHRHGARRELQEEAGFKLPLSRFDMVGILEGYFDQETHPRWIVYLYRALCTKPVTLVPEKKFLDMKWFPVNNLPFKQMIPGDDQWMPRVFRGERVKIVIRHSSAMKRLISLDVSTLD